VIAVGDVVGGRFRIDSILGTGGMGVVVAATHLELGHRVAIKFLRDEMAGNPTIVDRFLREARAVVHLRTEHVCRVTDVGRTTDGAPYIVMELLEGVDLQRVVARQPLPPPLAVAYVVQTCVALAEAHAAGIIHRDLKPANLFVTHRLDGSPLVKVLDFGIAKALADTGAHLTHTQGAMGSPGYMSPEQLQSARDVDVRTDIWALGVTLYQLLSARLPFTGTTPAEIAVRVATDPPARLDVEPRLRAIVMRCLEKPQDRRYPDVAALAAELATCGDPATATLVPTIQALARRAAGYVTPSPSGPLPTAGATMATALPSAVPVTAARTRRRRWPIVAGVLVALVACAIVLAMLPDAQPVAVARDAAAEKLASVTIVDAQVATVVRADAVSDADSSDLFGGLDVLGSNSDFAALMAQTQQMAAAACKQISTKTDPLSALAELTCGCTTKDAKRALAAWPHVTMNRPELRELCTMQGITLPP
jgi:hypothetical protein